MMCLFAPNVVKSDLCNNMKQFYRGMCTVLSASVFKIGKV